MAQAADRQHPPRRGATRWAWSPRARTPAPTRPATAATTCRPRACPPRCYDRQVASGFTHFQQSGTGAIRKYYNYFRVTPMLQPLDDLGQPRGTSRTRSPSPATTRRRCRPGIRCEITVGPKSAVHRYTFPRHHDARLVVDLSLGGLAIPHGRTVPLRAHLHAVAPGVAQGQIVVEGAPLAVHVECDTPQWRRLLWYDRRLMPGGTRLDFDHIRPTTLRPFGLMWAGPTRAGPVRRAAVRLLAARRRPGARQPRSATAAPGRRASRPGARRRRRPGTSTSARSRSRRRRTSAGPCSTPRSTTR